jgi:HEPN domain-containing protein
VSDATNALRWYRQAEADLATAEANRSAHPYAACFFAQQAAEKAMKALEVAESGSASRSHSIARLLERLTLLAGTIDERRAKALDRLYQETRYPDVIPDFIPAEFFTVDDADEALSTARDILSAVRAVLRALPGGCDG